MNNKITIKQKIYHKEEKNTTIALAGGIITSSLLFIQSVPLLFN